MHTPEVCRDALIPCKPRHVATVRGKLADSAPKAGDVLRGVLVQQQGQQQQDQVVHPDELSTFTKLTAGGLNFQVLCRSVWAVLLWHVKFAWRRTSPIVHVGVSCCGQQDWM